MVSEYGDDKSLSISSLDDLISHFALEFCKLYVFLVDGCLVLAESGI